MNEHPSCDESCKPTDMVKEAKHIQSEAESKAAELKRFMEGNHKDGWQVTERSDFHIANIYEMIAQLARILQNIELKERK